MRWKFSEGTWFAYDANGKCGAIIECYDSTRTVWTAEGRQSFSKLTHTLDDLQRLSEVLVRLEL